MSIPKSLALTTVLTACLLCAGCRAHGGVPHDHRSGNSPGPGAEVRREPSSLTPQRQTIEADRSLEPARRFSGEDIAVPAELTLEQAFLMALQANKEVAVTSVRVGQDEHRITRARGEFDPTIFAEAVRGRSELPEAGVPLGREESAVGAGVAGIRKRFLPGTEVELSATTDYERRLSGPSVLNPQYDTGARVSVEQDLLRGFGVGVNRTEIAVAQNDWRTSKERLRSSTIETLFEVERVYWDLYFARTDLQVREKQLERALTLVERARAYVDVGFAPPLDITRAESSAASQRVAIIQARNRVQTLRHQLLRLLGVSRPEDYTEELALTDEPSVIPFEQSLQQALRLAKEHRPELQQAHLSIESAELLEQFHANRRLPRLSLFGQYSLAGLDDGFRPSADQVSDGDHASWLVGLRFELPIPNRTARSDYQVARLESRALRLERDAVLERITREVADALTNLQAAAGRVDTSEEARRLAEQLLEAEEKSFSLGRSNSLDVLSAQAALATAERDEVRARADYATALANLLRAKGTLLGVKGVRME